MTFGAMHRFEGLWSPVPPESGTSLNEPRANVFRPAPDGAARTFRWDVPTSMMWIRRAVDEGRLRRTLPTDMREWSEGDRRAFQAAYAFECESGRGRPPMPQPWHLQAILGTRDLRAAVICA